MVKVALYARVSTRDKQQDFMRQVVLLQREAERLGWEVVRPDGSNVAYWDEESGFKESRYGQRSGLAALLADAKERKFDVVLVESQDRFSRLSSLAALKDIDFLVNKCGIRYKTVTDGIDSDNKESWDLVLMVMAKMANQFSRNLSSKIKSGIDRKQRDSEGRWLGAWGNFGKRSEKFYKPLVPQVLKLKRENPSLSLRKIAAQVFYVENGRPKPVSHMFVKSVLNQAKGD